MSAAPEYADYREVCTDPRWHDTNCAIGDATGVCGRYTVDGKCPGNPNHYGVARLAPAAPPEGT